MQQHAAHKDSIEIQAKLQGVLGKGHGGLNMGSELL